jgi:glycosyltransferase involved in cell wall biosynthesis
MCISVVIPYYNSEQYLAAAIESVLTQTDGDWELLLVNDGSQDTSVEIASAYATKNRRIKLIEQANAGVAEARNTGYAHISRDTKYVCFLDADDMLEPDALNILKGALENNPSAVAAHGKARYIGEKSEPIMPPPLTVQVVERKTLVGNEITPSPDSPLTTFEMLIVANCIVTPGACLICRSHLHAVGLFDRAMNSCEDWDMWIRLSRKGELAYVNQVVVAYRRHSENVSNDMKRHQMAGDRVRKKATFSPENSPTQAEIARTVYDLLSSEEYDLRLQWAREALQQGNMFAAAKQFRHASLARARARHFT